MSISDDLDDLALGCEDRVSWRVLGWRDCAPRAPRKARAPGSVKTRATLRAAQGFMRLPDVAQRVGLGRSTIYRMIEQGSFPKPVSMGVRNSQWVQSEVDAWIQARIDARDRT